MYGSCASNGEDLAVRRVSQAANPAVRQNTFLRIRICAEIEEKKSGLGVIERIGIILQFVTIHSPCWNRQLLPISAESEMASQSMAIAYWARLGVSYFRRATKNATSTTSGRSCNALAFNITGSFIPRRSSCTCIGSSMDGTRARSRRRLEM